ncbi:FAD-dependent oxidoreductase [Saxibacter everestensis]|uniref:FAD-dependent oxidoreductase n=1 Tax=Saxibacter everestensis TaxID=2909229 RepID=A0ABY8QT40_9MICO|nr:FAD-dependent oxidoreductase [Brevibacteriaceae bacterium ZFBP1038]
MENIVIVGNGQAGVQLVDSLRAEGYAGKITLLGEENQLPYQRPPLSKDYLAAGSQPQSLPLRAASFYRDNTVDSRLGVQVIAVDRRTRTVRLGDGSEVEYSKLVLATGAANRELTVPGSDLAGIHGLRTLADAEVVHARLDTVRSIVVVGAGFIGLEFAAAARQRGIDVTVLEFADRPMGRAVSPAISEYFADAHRRAGVNLQLGDGIASFEGRNGHVTTVVGTTGRSYPADFVLVGIGVEPRTELASAAGLPVQNGITVDAAMCTMDPDIFALGDCANYPNRHAGARTRLESVQNATDQARHTAKAIVGEAEEYAVLPWFWSQQGNLKLQIAGLVRPGDQTIVRGEPATGKFSVFCFRDGELAAVESVNQPADHMAARRLLGQRRSLSTAQARDPEFDFRNYSKLQPAVAG